MNSESSLEWEPVPILRASFASRCYDFFSLLFLVWPVTGGMALLGSTRVWGWSIGLVFAFLGCIFVFLRPLFFSSETLPWRIPALWVGLALTTLYVGCTVPFAWVPAEARWDALKWLCLCMGLLAWIQFSGPHERWKLLAFILLLALSMECFYAISRQVSHSHMVLWVQRPAQYAMRASGTFLCPNHLANVLAMAFPLAVTLLFSTSAGAPLRIMSVYYLAVAAPVLYWTQSRSGWVSMAIGVGMAVLLMAWRKSRRALYLALVALPLMAAAVGWGAWECLPFVRSRIGVVLEDPVAAGGVRAKMWRDMPAMIREKPVWGFGGGSFVWAYPPYRVHTDEPLTYDYLHNDGLHLAVEYGAVGFILTAGIFLWGFFLLVCGALRARDGAASALCISAASATLVAWLHSLFDFNFHIFPNPHVLLMICGMALGVWAVREKPARKWSKGASMAIAGVLALLCAGGLWFSLAGGMSYFWNLRGEMARTSLEYEQAEQAYARSIRWDAWNWRPWLGIGNMKSTQGFWFRAPDAEVQRQGKRDYAEAAEKAFLRAQALNPGEMAIECGLGRAATAVGDSETALKHYRAAAAYQPKHIFYREQLGIQLRRMGRNEEALEVFRRNIEDKAGGDISRLNIRSLEKKLARVEKAAESSASASPATPLSAP